jgi:hypothetical protein
MLIIADARLPERVLKNLERYGEVMPFASQGIVYDSISGHPDIFLCQTPKGLVVASNTPAETLNQIVKSGATVATGQQPVGVSYPASAIYNAFSGSELLVHSKDLTDSIIIKKSEGLKKVDVKQGYTRCNLVEAGGLFITSDRGIEKELQKAGKDTFFVDPSLIQLPGQKHGFFGGCTGVHKNILFLSGSLKHFPEGPELIENLEKRGIELVELYDGPLWDGGSIYFISSAISSSIREE